MSDYIWIVWIALISLGFRLLWCLIDKMTGRTQSKHHSDATTGTSSGADNGALWWVTGDSRSDRNDTSVSSDSDGGGGDGGGD